MPRKKTSLSSRVAKMVYLPPAVAKRLEKAADKTDLSQSGYMLQALKAQLKKDGIE